MNAIEGSDADTTISSICGDQVLETDESASAWWWASGEEEQLSSSLFQVVVKYAPRGSAGLKPKLSMPWNVNLDYRIVYIAMSHSPAFPPKEGESWVWLLDVRLQSSQGFSTSTLTAALLAPVSAASQVKSRETPPDGFLRPVYRVEDLSGTVSRVAMYTPSPKDDATRLRIEPGRLLILKNALPKTFLDGSMGFRVEQPEVVEVRAFIALRSSLLR